MPNDPLRAVKRDYSWPLLIGAIALYLAVHITVHLMGAEAFE